MEGTHRELRSRLADRLRGDDPDRHAGLDELAGGEVHAVAATADAEGGLAGHWAADLDLLDLHFLKLLRVADRDHLAFADHHLVGDRIDDVDPADAASNRLHEADLDLFPLVDNTLGDALRGAAVFHRDDDVLRDVRELTRQVARVGRLQRRVGQAFSGSVRRGEVFQDAQAFAEVGLDRRFDDLARGLGHQTTHAGQLADLFDTASGTRVGHQEDRVQVDLTVSDVVAELLHHLAGDLFTGVGPGIEHLVIALLLGDDAAVVELGRLGDFLLGVVQDLSLRLGGLEVVGRERKPRPRRFAEAEVLHRVEQVDRLSPAEDLVTVGDDPLELLLAEREVVIRHLRVKDVVEDHAAGRGLDDHAGSELLLALALELLMGREPHFDHGVNADLALRERQEEFIGR